MRKISVKSIKRLVLANDWKFLIACIISFNCFNAQDLPNNNIYTQNFFTLNDGFSGFSNQWQISLWGSSIANGFTDAPKALAFVMDGPLTENLSIGAKIISEEMGLFKSFYGSVVPSYRIRFPGGHMINFGVSVGFVNRTFDQSSLFSSGQVDLTDPVLQNNDFENVNVRFGFGTAYAWKNLVVGLALPALFEDGEKFNGRFSGIAIYHYTLPDPAWRISPSFLYKVFPDNPNQYDGNIMAEWKEMAWVQAGYRSNNDVLLATGFNLENLRIGYSFALTTGDRQVLYSGAQQLIVSYRFGKKGGILTTAEIREQESKELEAREEETRKLIDTRFEEINNRLENISKSTDRIQQIEEDIGKLEQEVGDVVKQNEEMVELDQLQGVLKSEEGYYDVEEGNYIIIKTTKELSIAKKLISLYEKQGMPTAIVYYSEKGFYYIYQHRYDNREEAIEKMQEKRSQGFTDSWVLVYRKK